MSELNRTIVIPETVANPLGAYTYGVRVGGGDLPFIAGQVAVARDGSLVGKGDTKAQTRQVFRNIGGVLEVAGGGFGNLVEFVMYLADKANVDRYRKARAALFPDMFPDGDFPTSTLVVVEALASDDYLIEVKVVASLDPCLLGLAKRFGPD